MLSPVLVGCTPLSVAALSAFLSIGSSLRLATSGPVSAPFPVASILSPRAAVAVTVPRARAVCAPRPPLALAATADHTVALSGLLPMVMVVVLPLTGASSSSTTITTTSTLVHRPLVVVSASLATPAAVTLTLPAA